MSLVVPVLVDLAQGAISANDRLHWAERAERVDALRNQSWVLHREAIRRSNATTGTWLPRPAFRRAHLTVHVAWPDQRRRDVANLSPTIKALVDGAVDADVLRDDDDKHLVGPDLRVVTFPGRRPRAGCALLTLEWRPAEETTT